jgi:hypothetical protein
MFYQTSVRTPPFPFVFQNFPGLRVQDAENSICLTSDRWRIRDYNGMGERLNISNLHVSISSYPTRGGRPRIPTTTPIEN